MNKNGMFWHLHVGFNRRAAAILLSILAFQIGAEAQTEILFEDFESGSLPPGWNVAVNNAAANDGGWLIGDSAGLSDSPRFEIPGHGNFAATADANCNCDKSNDLLILPEFNLAQYTRVYADLEIYYPGDTIFQTGNSFPGERADLILLDGNNNACPLKTFPSNVFRWSKLSFIHVSDSCFPANTPVRIAIRYNDNFNYINGYQGRGIALDDIRVYEVPQYDVKGVELLLQDYVLISQPILMAGSFANIGYDTIKNVALSYRVNQEPVVVDSLDSLHIPHNPGGSTVLTSTIQWQPTSTGNNQLRMWVSSINGSNDYNPENDTIYKSVYVSNSLANRLTLIEQFNNWECDECRIYSPQLYNLLDSNLSRHKLTHLSYHVGNQNSGNQQDALYAFNPVDADARANYYGHAFQSRDANHVLTDGLSGRDYQNLTQSGINDRHAAPAIFKMNISLTLEYSNKIMINGSFQSLIENPDGELNLRIAIIEDTVLANSSPNEADTFFSVVRRMFPTANGIPLGALAENETKNFEHTYWIPEQLNASGLKAVAFIQNDDTKEVMQAAASNRVLVGIKPVEPLASPTVYPNPARERLCISSGGRSGKIKIELYSISGTVKTSYDFAPAGNELFHIHTGAFQRGIYYVRIIDGANVSVRKIVLQ